MLLFKEWKDFFKKKLVKSYRGWFSGDFKKSGRRPVYSSSSLHRSGISVKSVPLSEVKEEAVILASQLPVHLFPWVAALKSGAYRIGFSPAIQSQIQSGVLNVTGGVARNSGGQIVAHGQPLPFMGGPAPGIFLYQIGVMVFGAFYLQKISQSLKKITEKLNTIYAFQLDKRTAQINSYFQEYSHLSKGILEFSKYGNVKETLKRIDTIRHLRIMNLSNLLHLQKDLHNEGEQLQNLKSSDWLGSKNSTQNLKEVIGDYARHLMDYKHSLFLDIACTKTEVCFSMFRSREETASRLLQQKKQLKDFKKQLFSFEKHLNTKTLQLIDSRWFFKEKETLRNRREVRGTWDRVQKIITNFNEICLSHIKDTENRVNSPHGHTLFLNKTDAAAKHQKPSSSNDDDQLKKPAA